MSIGDRLGLLGVVLTLIGFAFPYLWPEKKWIGWVSVSLAFIFIGIWGTAEIKERWGKQSYYSALSPFRSGRPDYSQLRILLVKLREIKPLRNAAYGNTFAIILEYKLDTNNSRNPAYNPTEAHFLALKIEEDGRLLSERNAKVAEIESLYSGILSQIALALPDTPEARSLITAASQRPTYVPTKLTDEEWAEASFHKWVRLQEPIANQALLEQSSYPIEALAKYINEVIGDDPARR